MTLHEQQANGSPMVVAHLSYAFLVLVAATHLLTASIVSFGISEVLKIRMAFVLPPTYVALLCLSAYLMLRNGRWGVDQQHIYKGWRLAPFIAIEEIEHAQIGLPGKWTSALSPAVASSEQRALLLRPEGK